ncbi:uncharacterized protein BDZ99DRAFT_530816 [Mytilinidion resinicola]|uniref:Uncharacterized protein n=1 Tax=Mytilinidion resinicola TaxID=574789 RepID=A0A6A6ZBM0_9PEZI|nr:uncharacterized protein BDZ99DRAFT_530816 [Mytilinidion resinicola]KAF2817704.1 hypothetical protein BDZ99DRAFT_530816 [Mytilinidion resinicola]
MVIIPDSFEWELPNNCLLADNYANKGGWLVYLPDFMVGYTATADLVVSVHALDDGGIRVFWHLYRVIRRFIPYMIENPPTVATSRIFTMFRELKKVEAADLPVGTAGFCRLRNLLFNSKC